MRKKKNTTKYGAAYKESNKCPGWRVRILRRSTWAAADLVMCEWRAGKSCLWLWARSINFHISRRKWKRKRLEEVRRGCTRGVFQCGAHQVWVSRRKRTGSECKRLIRSKFFPPIPCSRAGQERWWAEAESQRSFSFYRLCEFHQKEGGIICISSLNAVWLK